MGRYFIFGLCPNISYGVSRISYGRRPYFIAAAPLGFCLRRQAEFRQNPAAAWGSSSSSVSEGGDVHGYIGTVPVLPGNHRHHWPGSPGKKEVTAPVPTVWRLLL